MLNEIKREIKRLSDRVLTREALRAKASQAYKQKFTKRTGQAALISTKPTVSKVSRQFEPLHCKRNANFLSKTVWHKIQSKTYEPQPALSLFIDKANGGKRKLMAFSIPDSAVANVLMRRVRKRNIKKFSPHSFAYHPDKNVFDAIIALRDYLRKDTKIFCVQIDFADYFESISHGYLRKLLEDRSIISLTEVERYTLFRFLKHEYAERADYALGVFKRRQRGTPQGSSVSLILSNLANHKLDVELERLPGKFVRFADDVTALCDNYEDALRIEQCFVEHCRISGIKVNKKKSPGIAILSCKESEMRTVSHFDYLGYRFTQEKMTLSDRKIKSIKGKVSRLIDIYLIHPIEYVGFNPSRVGISPNFDWDLLGLIYEIRNYMYGGLSEQALKSFLYHNSRLPRMKGLMGFYALLDDQAPLVGLDGWLVSSIKQACRKRAHILANKYSSVGLTPSTKELTSGSWLSLSAWQGGSFPETEVPSFLIGWRAAKKYLLTFGLNEIETDEVEAYSYDLP